MPSKRQRHMVHDPTVPDISDDAAERKRVLNVLAQRRYRKRRREHLASLEAHIQMSHQKTRESGVVVVVDPSPTDSAAENQSGLDILLPLGATECETGNISPASSGTVQRIQEALLETSNDGSPGALTDVFTQSNILDVILESMTQNSPSSSSSSSIMPLSPPSSFDSLFSSGLAFPELSALSYQLLQNPINEQDFTPNDLSATLQSYQATTFTFPDDHIIEIPPLSLLRAVLTIADRLQLKELIWTMNSISPFYTGPAGFRCTNSAPPQSSSTTSSLSSSRMPICIESLPAHLQPTPTQRLIPHHPILDLFPWPTTRNKLIQVFSMPEDLRPASASHPMALMNLVYDIEDPTEGMRVSGTDPFQIDMWEIGQRVFERWWWAFETKVIDISNNLRQNRGQQGLAILLS
ncbi:hypothetical protein PAAG_00600 [Paracoccidioides lutzii Pb01]|uniref:BZIP domain-containing protein n=1 Tax=Paracoccidioides lutzii (strain ATCC MYA-826 / Pb01) TaxID=502779 RepID=C1GQ05_PARBA|nr:hypothetical protein PAAG_00600 [Paracoccidioides lutzii Pb01]EEH36277.1 hypothetical protein PAAG_00600 [Paracoccidioides lutzii Pb01]